MTEPSTLSVILGFAGFLVLASAVAWVILLVAARFAPEQPADTSTLDHLDGVTNAAPAPESKPVQGRADHHCTVPFCDDPVQVFLRVGHDTWTFCLPHGLPHLTEQSARERKGGAA